MQYDNISCNVDKKVKILAINTDPIFVGIAQSEVHFKSLIYFEENIIVVYNTDQQNLQDVYIRDFDSIITLSSDEACV